MTPKWPPVPCSMRGRAHEAVALPDAALSDLTRAAAGARAAGDRRLEMLALRELGGDVPVSLGLPITYNGSNLERGLQIAESLGDRASEADLLSRLAVVAANRLDYDLALDYGLRGLAAGRASGDEQAVAAGLDGLKTAYVGIGDAPALSEVLAELGPLVRRLGDPFRLQWAEFESAFVCVAAADWDGALQAIQAAIEANRRAGYPHFTSWYVAHLGWLARLRGHDDEAVTQGRRALALTELYPHPWALALGCAMLGSTLLLAGDRTEAIRLFERGLAAAEEAGVEAACCTARRRWPRPPGRGGCWTRPRGCWRRRASRTTAPGCWAKRPTCRSPAPGWPAASRNVPARCWRRCWSCRAVVPWVRHARAARSPWTGARSSSWAAAHRRPRS